MGAGSAEGTSKGTEDLSVGAANGEDGAPARDGNRCPVSGGQSNDWINTIGFRLKTPRGGNPPSGPVERRAG
ncbi:hypothetical protein GCM10027426_21570 [Microbacterium lacusdiani]